ncbi:UNVERIFIED_CONTAM: movement protein [Sesamum angustifolium]|uniref:Movement protein n=1 Tax=Sesamum angustifolium TaxID=2727405 RepID=A0AAW2MJW0_9LAMI
MRQDSNLSPYDRFRIGGIGKVLNQIGLNQRKHHIIYKVSSSEFAIPMEFTGNMMEMQLIPKEEILEEFSRLREEIAVTIKWIHIGTIEVIIKATFKEGIDSKTHSSIMDRRINNIRDSFIGTMIGNLYAEKLMFDIHPRIAYNLADQDFSRVLTLHQDFKRNNLIKEGKSISRFPEFSRNSLRIMGYKGKEKELLKVLTPQEIRQPVVSRYEGRLEIAGHEILFSGVARRENGNMILELSFLEDHKLWGKKDQEFAQQNLEFALKKQRKPYMLLQEGFLTKNPNTQYGNSRSQNHDRRSIWNAWFRVKTLPFTFMIQVFQREKAFKRIMPMNFSKRGDFDAKLTHPKMQDKGKFGKVLLSFRQQGLIDSDNFYEESGKEIKNLKEALQELKSIDISEESKLSLENVKRLIQRKFCIELQEHIVEKIRNFSDVLKDKKHLQSFLGVVNFAGIFIKDLAKYRNDFQPLLKETESAKWKWEEIHMQRVRELKQVCNKLPKLAIPQDEDELVVYTDANDYRWVAVLMKTTTTGEEPCRYT